MDGGDRQYKICTEECSIKEILKKIINTTHGMKKNNIITTIETTLRLSVWQMF